MLQKNRIEITEIFHRAQLQSGEGGHYSRYSKNQLDNGYYLPMTILLEGLSCSKEKRFLFNEECYRYTNKKLDYRGQTQQVLSILKYIVDEISAKDNGEIYFEIISNALLEAISDISPKAKSSKVKLLLIGDCLMTDIRCFLRGLSAESPIEADVYCNYFGASDNSDFNVDEILAEVEEKGIDIIGLSFLSYDGLPYYRAARKSFSRMRYSEGEDFICGIIDSVRNSVQKIREKTDKTIVLHNCGGLPLPSRREHLKFLNPFSKQTERMLRIINKGISEVVRETCNCYLLDESEIVKKFNPRHCNQIILEGNLSSEALIGHRRYFGNYVAAEYLELMLAYSSLKNKKLLAIDFDNTLWKGVMADGEIIHYHDRQLLLRKLKDIGIVLAAVSKNSQENIKWGSMSLKEDDFVSLKINWEQKSKSLHDIATELNLGIDSFIFIDDNPVELDMVNQTHPKVLSLDATHDRTWRWLSLMESFPCTSNTEAARNRTEMYKSQARRTEILSTAPQVNHENLMRSLGLSLSVTKAKTKDIERCYELAQRTNQFNTTTRRYSLQEIKDLIDSTDANLYIGRMQDRFGDLDLVLMAVLFRQENRISIESLIMSCRAMGFGAEYLFLQKLLEHENNDICILARYLKTDKNSPALSFLKQAGFTPADEEKWELGSAKLLKNVPDWFS